MNWLREHGFALRSSLARLRSAPGSFSFNVVVIALALILPLAGLTLLENLRPVSRELAVEPEISVFLSSEASRERAQALGTELREAAASAGLTVMMDFIPREKALAALKERAGLNDVVTTLGSNPLPDAYVIRLAARSDQAGGRAIEQLAESYRRLPSVETVQLDAAWVKRLAALLHVAEIALWLLAGALTGVVVAVVFNTVRLQVITQSEEIAVARLLGATDAFVSRPFYYVGAWLGLCAGALALAGVLGALAWLNAPVGELAGLYGTDFQLSPLDAISTALLLVATTGLGIIGAMLSVWQALRRAS
jgi:cell division transport system permease protein